MLLAWQGRSKQNFKEWNKLSVQTVSTKVFSHIFFLYTGKLGQYGIEMWLKKGEINSLAGWRKRKTWTK
jgi:hypothetical protein